MANNLIPEDLQALIAQYLTDGVLTAKEREVILKKAEAMGLDRDEIDLYLDAEVQKIDQATDAAVRKQKGRQCPFCGASIPVLTDKCPECGGNITPEADKELGEIFENLEDALVDLKSGKNINKSRATVERYVRKAKMYYSNNPKIQILLAEVEAEVATANAKRKRVTRLKWIGAGICFLLSAALFIHASTIDYVKAPEPDSFWKSRETSPEEDTHEMCLVGGILLAFGGVIFVISTFASFSDNEKSEE